MGALFSKLRGKNKSTSNREATGATTTAASTDAQRTQATQPQPVVPVERKSASEPPRRSAAPASWFGADLGTVLSSASYWTGKVVASMTELGEDRVFTGCNPDRNPPGFGGKVLSQSSWELLRTHAYWKRTLLTNKGKLSDLQKETLSQYLTFLGKIPTRNNKPGDWTGIVLSLPYSEDFKMACEPLRSVLMKAGYRAATVISDPLAMALGEVALNGASLLDEQAGKLWLCCSLGAGFLSTGVVRFNRAEGKEATATTRLVQLLWADSVAHGSLDVIDKIALKLWKAYKERHDEKKAPLLSATSPALRLVASDIFEQLVASREDVSGDDMQDQMLRLRSLFADNIKPFRFEYSLVATGLQEIEEKLRDLLSKMKKWKKQSQLGSISAVILAGGMREEPCLREVFTDKWKDKVRDASDPTCIAAHGAALLAGMENAKGPGAVPAPLVLKSSQPLYQDLEPWASFRI